MFNKLYFKYLSLALKNRLLVSILLLSTILTLISTSLITYQNYTEQLTRVQNTHNIIKNTYKDSLVKAAWSFNFEQLSSILNGIYNFPNVHYLKFSSKEIDEIKLGERTNKEWFLEKEIILNKDSVELGRVLIYSDLDKSIFTHMIDQVFVILITQLIQYILITLMVLFIIHRLILSPLKKMDDYTKEISSDFNNLPSDLLLSIDTPIEFLQLNQTVSELKNRLQKHIQKLKEYQENLEILVSDRTNQLNKALLKAEEANTSKSQFLSNVTHELKTPLNAVILLSKLLAKNLKENLTQEDIKKITIINKSGYDLLNLVNELLDLSKIEAGKLKFTFKEFNLSQLLQDIYEQLQPSAIDKDIVLVDEIEDDFFITSDPGRISQICKNIISNAIKFTDKGSVTIQLKSSQNEDYKYVLRVIDTGIGIKESDLSKVFERYKQINNSSIDINAGSGLGLYISHMISSKLLCHIEIQSKFEEGTIFDFYIKDLESYIQLEDNFVPTEDLSIFNTKNIVMVDDDERNLFVLKELFEGINANLYAYNSPVDLIRNADKLVDIDLFIIDYRMPYINGIDLANNIDNYEKFKNVPKFILTANTDEDFFEISKNSPISVVLVKPLNPSELVMAYKNHYTRPIL